MSAPIWTGVTSGSWSVTTNWSTAAVPVSTDDVYLIQNGVNITAGLDQHTVALDSLTVDMGFTALVGDIATYLQIGCTTADIGTVQSSGAIGSGSQRLNFNFGSSTVTVNVINTAYAGIDSGQAPVRLLGTGLTINLLNGIISVAADPDESATVTALNVSNGGNQNIPSAYLGQGATVTTLSQTAGTVTSASGSAITTATISGNGTQFIHTGTGGFTTASVQAGATLAYDGTGTTTTLNLFGTLDLSGGGGAVTFTTINVYQESKIVDPLGRGTFTTKNLIGCNMTNVNINVGQGRTF